MWKFSKSSISALIALKKFYSVQKLSLLQNILNSKSEFLTKPLFIPSNKKIITSYFFWNRKIGSFMCKHNPNKILLTIMIHNYQIPCIKKGWRRMAKSIRLKRERERERRPCAIRREIVEKDGTKCAAQEAALSTPELLVRVWLQSVRSDLVDINICIFMSTTHLLNFKNSLLHFAVFQSFYFFFIFFLNGLELVILLTLLCF